MAIRFTCNCKGKYHDYGSLKKLRQHEKTATHKSFIDPVFAEAERQRKKDARPTIKCCVEACEYSSSDPSHLRRHEKVCKATIGTVAASNGKRAKSGDHGGHRDGAGRKPEDVVSTSNGQRAKSGGHGGHRDGAGRNPEDDVASTIRRGLPECDPWPWNGEGRKTYDNGNVDTGDFKRGILFNGSFMNLYRGTMYVPQIVIALLSVQISFTVLFSDSRELYVKAYGMVRVFKSFPMVMCSKESSLMAYCVARALGFSPTAKSTCLSFFFDKLKILIFFNTRKYYQKAILFSASRYEGAFKNGEKHGQGIETNADGSRCFLRLQDSLLLIYSLIHLSCKFNFFF